MKAAYDVKTWPAPALESCLMIGSRTPEPPRVCGQTLEELRDLPGSPSSMSGVPLHVTLLGDAFPSGSVFVPGRAPSYRVRSRLSKGEVNFALMDHRCRAEFLFCGGEMATGRNQLRLCSWPAGVGRQGGLRPIGPQGKPTSAVSKQRHQIRTSRRSGRTWRGLLRTLAGTTTVLIGADHGRKDTAYQAYSPIQQR